MIIWPFQNLWILPIDKLPGTTIPLPKKSLSVFHKDHLFLYEPYLFFPSSVLSSHCHSDSALSNPISFSSECAFEPSFQTYLERLTISWSSESIVSHSFFLLYKTYYLKSLTRLSVVSIVNKRATIITHFWVIPQIHLFFFPK
jgi:hypothetical protein